jgi:hypothetical protein
VANESFHINGPAIICVATFGVGGSGGGTELKRLGISANGVDVSFEEIQEDVQTDAGGNVPADIQFYGTVAVLDFTLVSYNDSILRAYLAKTVGSKTYAHGTNPPAGILLGGSGNLKKIAIVSPTLYGEAPYTFPFSAPSSGRSNSVNLGVKRKGHRLSVRCISGIGPAMTAENAVLYHRDTFTVPD